VFIGMDCGDRGIGYEEVAGLIGLRPAGFVALKPERQANLAGEPRGWLAIEIDGKIHHA
jgi:hypothetical protein